MYKPSKGGHREAKKRQFIKRQANLAKARAKRIKKQTEKNEKHAPHDLVFTARFKSKVKSCSKF